MSTPSRQSKNLTLRGCGKAYSKVLVEDAKAKSAQRAEQARQAAEREAEHLSGKMQGSSKFTNMQILEIRALHQFAGWRTKQLMERFKASRDSIYRVIMGVTGAKLVATREHLPADVVAP